MKPKLKWTNITKSYEKPAAWRWAAQILMRNNIINTNRILKTILFPLQRIPPGSPPPQQIQLLLFPPANNNLQLASPPRDQTSLLQRSGGSGGSCSTDLDLERCLTRHGAERSSSGRSSLHGGSVFTGRCCQTLIGGFGVWSTPVVTQSWAVEGLEEGALREDGPPLSWTAPPHHHPDWHLTRIYLVVEAQTFTFIRYLKNTSVKSRPPDFSLVCVKVKARGPYVARQAILCGQGRIKKIVKLPCNDLKTFFYSNQMYNIRNSSQSNTQTFIIVITPTVKLKLTMNSRFGKPREQLTGVAKC